MNPSGKAPRASRNPGVTATTRAGLAAWLLLIISAPAHARSPLTRPPPGGNVWVEAHAGWAFSDVLALREAGDEFGPKIEPETTDDGGLAFGVGVHWRARRFDLGGFVESIASGAFARLESSARFGSQVRFASMLRWRYVDEGWGGLYVRLTPGLGIFELSDPLRFEVSKISSAQQFQDVDDRVFGFTMGFKMGIHFYLADRFSALFLELGSVLGTASVLDGADQVSYTRTRGLLVVGLEWAPQ